MEKTREKRRSLTRPPSPWHSPLTSVSLLAQPSIQHAQVSRQYLSSPFCLVVCCLRKTIFSPYLVISIPVILHLHSISSRLVLIVSYFWGAVICFIRGSIHLSMTKIYTTNAGLLCYADWRYANQARWFHAPPKLQWEDQVVLITGGEIQFALQTPQE